jgi:hypothetical protein
VRQLPSVPKNAISLNHRYLNAFHEFLRRAGKRSAWLPGGLFWFVQAGVTNMDQEKVFAQQLEREGFDARGDLFNGQIGVIVGPKGLDLTRMPPDEIGIFFPLWEINAPEN